MHVCGELTPNYLHPCECLHVRLLFLGVLLGFADVIPGFPVKPIGSVYS